MSENREIFKEKSLKMYIKRLEELAENSKNGEEALQTLNEIISSLIGSKRFFDISSMYVFLKSAFQNKRGIGAFYEPAKGILKRDINELFTKSITYNNFELKEMFSDILGTDTGLLMELVSFIFKKYDLFGMELSENINRQLIKVAEEDIFSFIEHADTSFLAFYLSSLPKLTFVPREHVEQWIEVILYQYQANNEKYTKKILSAMKIHPSLDILLLFILSPRQKDRSEALLILTKYLSSRQNGEFAGSFAEKAPYFIKKAVKSGLFYDFHTIPTVQKELFAELTKYTDGGIVRETVLPLLRTANKNGNSWITKSKLAFVPAVRHFLPAFPAIVPQLNVILRDENIEIEVKEEIRKLVYNQK